MNSVPSVNQRLPSEPLVIARGRLSAVGTLNCFSAPTGAASEGGYGLIGMHERIRAVGGRLEITRADGRFRVTAELPLDAGVDLARKEA